MTKVEIKFPSKVIGKIFLVSVLLDLLHQRKKTKLKRHNSLTVKDIMGVWIMNYFFPWLPLEESSVKRLQTKSCFSK